MNKVVLITGGTRGIGLGITKAFLNKDFQAVTNYRSDRKRVMEVEKQLNLVTRS
jgi:NAD(P)-dependent dehydrogenase (short-subunit alcohol dehydrogenase family)